MSQHRLVTTLAALAAIATILTFVFTFVLDGDNDDSRRTNSGIDSSDEELINGDPDEPELPTSAVTRTLPLIPDLSTHVWQSMGGGTQVLDPAVNPFRAGVSHVEDLPPAGESIAVFSYELSPVSGDEIDEARLDLNVDDFVGAPFTEFGALVVEEVSFGDVSRILATPAVQELARVTTPDTVQLPLRGPVRDAIRRGNKRFQLRIAFAGVLLPNVEAEMSARDSYVEWREGPVLSVTVSR